MAEFARTVLVRKETLEPKGLRETNRVLPRHGHDVFVGIRAIRRHRFLHPVITFEVELSEIDFSPIFRKYCTQRWDRRSSHCSHPDVAVAWNVYDNERT